MHPPLKYKPRIEHYEAVQKLFEQNDVKPKVGAEIGVRHGDFSEYLLRNNPQLDLHLVDSYAPYKDLEYQFTQEEQDKIQANAWVRLKPYRVEWRTQTSVNASKSFSPLSLDFVFIDAEHTYEAVMSDILHWYPKIKERGLLMGHDFSMVQVKKAVTEWHYYNLRRTLSPILHTGYDSDVWAIRL